MTQLDRVLIERGYLKPRDTAVVVAGQPVGRAGTTNILKMHQMGESV
jgi:pyruvate kinase